MEELQSFIGKRIDLKKVQDVLSLTLEGEGYWELNESCHCVFKGKEMAATVLSANWIGSIGQTIYFVNGDILETDPEDRTSYVTCFL